MKSLPIKWLNLLSNIDQSWKSLPGSRIIALMRPATGFSGSDGRMAQGSFS
jgi:hypothetical protein